MQQIFKNKKYVTVALLALLCAVLIPVVASAAYTPTGPSANEYYTYNGFGPVQMAFKKIALIFSDNGYLVFFTAFATLAVTFGAASAYGKMLGGGATNGSYMSWMVPVFFGTMVYLAAIVPKTHIELYDPVLNQTDVINGIPVGIVYTATMLNHVERAMVDIVNTAAPVGRDYTLTAGGVGIDLLGKTVTNSVHDANASRTMGEFVQKCVMFELTRPGTALSMQNLLVTTGGTTILDAMIAAKNPAVFTVNYLTSPEGVPGSCSAVYDELVTYYTTAANMSSALSNACGGAGIDSTNASALAQCQAIIGDVASNTFGDTFTYTDVLSNASIARITADYLKSASADVATQLSAAQNISASGSGEGFTSIFNTISRAAFTAFVIAMIPLVALFIPTPFCKNALAMIFGLFVWVITWNLCELIIHQFFMDYYYRTVTSVTNAGFGMQAMLDLPSYSSVAMGTFGKLKAGAAGFATVVTGGIFKFGGSEMSHFAARMGQSTSGSQGSMLGSSGRAGAVAEHQSKQEHVAMARMSSAWTNQGAVSMDQMATGKAGKQMNMAAQGAGMLSFGGGAAGAWNNAAAGANQSAAEQFGKTSNMTTAQAIQSGRVNAGTIQGTLAAMGNNAIGTASTNAYVDTMKKSGHSQEYSSMVGQYAKAAGIDMNTDAGKKQAYGEFAALDLASNKGLMNAFSDKDGQGNIVQGSGAKNYQDFMEANHGKSRGQMEGEQKAFTAAKDAGFSGGWKDYHALQSQMGSLNGYANADSWQKIANSDHYKGQPLRMFSDIQAVQNSQTAGNAIGVAKEAQSSAGAALTGSLAKDAPGLNAKEMSAAKDAYEQGGVAGLKTSLASSEWGQKNAGAVEGAATNAHNAATSQGVLAMSATSGEIAQKRTEGAADGFRGTTNPDDVRTGATNEFDKNLGTNVDAVNTAFQGSGLDARQQAALTEGMSKLQGISSAQMKQTAAGVMFGGSDPKNMMQQFKSEAGIMSGVLTASGAAALNSKLGKKGLFKSGDQVTYGMGADGSVKVGNAQRGGYKLQKDGKSEELWGNKLTNTGSVKESRTQSFSGSNTVAGDFVDKVDGKTGVETKGAGTTNPKTGAFTLTNGTKAAVVTTSGVETVRDAKGNAVADAVVTRTGDASSGSVAVKADGSTVYDGSTRATTGTAITNIQTLAGSASDGSLSGGTAAQVVAVGEQAVGVAAQKMSQIGGLVSAPRGIASPNGALTRAEARAEQTAARQAQTAAPPPPPPPPSAPKPSPQQVAKRTAAVKKSRSARYSGNSTPSSRLPDAQNGNYSPKYSKPAKAPK